MGKETFMNLMTDFAFKKLFGEQANKRILLRFLNILFAPEGKEVRDVTFLDKEVLPEGPDGKRILYDIYCVSAEEKEHIIVEMQQVYHDFFENRTVFYSSKAMAMQGRKGGNYNELRPVYSIFLVDFHFPHMTKKTMHDVRLMDIHSHEIYSDLFRMLFLHLADAKHDWDSCTTDYDKILFLIKNMHKMDKDSKAYKSREFDEMFREAEIDNLVNEEAVAYSQSRLKYEETLAAVDYASNSSFERGIAIGEERGREAGIAIGEERGREAGIAIGEERGRQAGIAIGEERIRMETAQKLRAAGFDEDLIKSITGISI